MVTNETLERACSEVGEYTEEQMLGEFDRLFQTQPAVCDFVVELTSDSGERIQELSLFLTYMVFKALELEVTKNVTSVTPAAIEAAYHNCESWIEKINSAEGTDLQAAIADSLQKDTEPYLLQYVISELNEDLEDGGELDDEEKGEVFFVLKTVIASIAADPNQ